MSLIYVVEDDTNIREIEAFALKNSGYQVEDFACAADFSKRLHERRPDLVLLDIMLPDEDGLSLLKKLRLRPDTALIPVILITAKTTELDKVKGFDIGADDYVTKPFGVMELISRVKALLRRSRRMLVEKRMELGSIEVDSESHRVTVQGKPVELTYKEFELLRFLILNHGKAVTREQIMENVWETEYGGETRTVDAHIKTLRQKLDGAGGYIKTVRNVGYIINEKED